AQGLGAGFLGGKAFGVGLDAPRAPLGLGALDRRVNAREEPFSVPLADLSDAPPVHDIGAHSDNHAAPAFARPRSIAARMNLTVSASPSKTPSPMRKWPMLSSIISGSVAIVSAVA